MSEWTYVLVAYGLTWLVLAAYALRANRKVARARERLDQERSR